MSNPPNGFNTNTSFNKYKGSYFNNDVDVSGGNIINRTGDLYLAPNSSIFTENNQIQFNEEFQFCDFIFLLPPLSAFISAFFCYQPKSWISVVIHWLVIALSIFIGVENLN
jgi:hypothetical protein